MSRQAPKQPSAGNSPASAKARREHFVELFIANGGCATQAARDAGFKGTANSLKTMAHTLMKEPAIKAEIERRRAELAERYRLTTENVLEELAGIVHFDVGDIFNDDSTMKPLKEWPPAVRRAIASIEFEEIKVRGKTIGRVAKVKVNDKNSALEKAMKHLGMFKRDNEQPAEAVAAVLAADPKEVARRVAFLLARGLKQ